MGFRWILLLELYLAETKGFLSKDFKGVEVDEDLSFGRVALFTETYGDLLVVFEGLEV